MVSSEEEGGLEAWSEHRLFMCLYRILCSQGWSHSGHTGKNDLELLIPLPPNARIVDTPTLLA